MGMSIAQRFFPAAAGQVQPQEPPTYKEAVLADSPVAYFRFTDPAPYNEVEATDTLTKEGGVLTDQSALFAGAGNSATLDGTDDAFEIDNLTPFSVTGSFTLELFLRLDQSLSNGDVLTLIRVSGTGETEAENTIIQASLYRFSDTSNIHTFHESGAGTNHIDDIPYEFLADTNYHVVLVRDAPNLEYRGYVNGSLEGSANFDETASGGSSLDEATLGRAASGEYFQGKWGDVAFYDKVLSGSRIAAHWNARNRA